MTLDLFTRVGTSDVALSEDGLDIRYWPRHLEDDVATNLFDELLRQSAWQQRSMWMYGRRVLMPRLTCWFGDEGATYKYSGVFNEPLPWTTHLHAMKLELEGFLSARFNSVLLNLYRDGRDYMSWHSDNEPELGSQPIVASLSLGASRRFDLKSTEPSMQRRRHSLILQHGSLLVMRGDTQRQWEHAVPKQLEVQKPRINLTFRWVEPKRS